MSFAKLPSSQATKQLGVDNSSAYGWIRVSHTSRTLARFYSLRKHHERRFACRAWSILNHAGHTMCISSSSDTSGHAESRRRAQNTERSGSGLFILLCLGSMAVCLREALAHAYVWIRTDTICVRCHHALGPRLPRRPARRKAEPCLLRRGQARAWLAWPLGLAAR